MDWFVWVIIVLGIVIVCFLALGVWLFGKFLDFIKSFVDGLL